MIIESKDYDSFAYHPDHRDFTEHKRLRESMKKYGWVTRFPLHVNFINGKYVTKDGHHRFNIAKEFGIPVKYVVCDDKIENNILALTKRKKRM